MITNNNIIQIYIKTIAGKLIALNLRPTKRIVDVKEIVSEIIEIPSTKTENLIFNVKKLYD